MSTFKVQPVYAELVLGWLDAAYLGVAGMTARDVLAAVQWKFKGGVLGAYPMRYPTESSGTRYPSGCTTVLAVAPDDDPDYVSLMALVRRRVVDRRKRARSCADWAATYAVTRAMCSAHSPGTPAITGMRAVYRVLLDMWECGAAPSRSTSYDRVRTYVREMTLASACSSHLDVAASEDAVSRTFRALGQTRMAAIRFTASEFDAMLRYTGSPAARQKSVQLGRELIGDHRSRAGAAPAELGAAAFAIAGRRYYALHGFATATVGGQVYALSRSDLLRVHQFLTGVQSGLFATVAQVCVSPGPERHTAADIGQTYEAQVTRLLETAILVPQGDEVSVCKAYKRAFGAFLGELSGPLCASETAALWEEAHSTSHAHLLSLDAWVACLRQWTASTAFNLGKVYKLCPAPDASPGLTLVERHEMVTNHNAIDPGALPELRDELRAQILRAYIRRPGVMLDLRDTRPSWYGAYRAGRFEEVPSSEIHKYLKWEGTAQMPQRSPDDPSVWKDSGLGWDTFDVATDPDRFPKAGNMLTRMVFDDSCPMPGIRHTGHSHDQKVDIKPEGHKDPARGIYSGNIRDRLNQSWMEAAVHEVAVGHPAFMVGADAEMRDNRVRAIVDRPHDGTSCAVYYSFDVSGWSPRMPPEVQHVSHSIWADLYDEPLFRSAHTITDGVRVYMNKGGYVGWFVNPGANFEGYNGKEMTMILITLMSLAVKDWRAAVVAGGLATREEAQRWSAVLLAYIDDGLAKLVLPADRAPDLFALLKTSSEARFARMGFSVEPSKCYPSDRFAIFLNEPYLGGRHVTHGTRAAMTICAENTEEHTSLLERLTSVSTGCRGAVMAGLDATTGVMLQAFHAYTHLCEWVRRPEPVLAAVWSTLPRGWGGLGMPTALQLGTSGGGSALEESVRTMQRWAHVSTPARVAFLKRARGKLAPRSATGILMAPMGGRTRDGTMVETRVPDAVRAALTRLRADGRVSKLAADFLGYASPQSLDTYAEAVVNIRPDAVVQEQLLADLASAHPHAIFSAFARRIEKSTTLMQLVGRREMRRIIKANRDDATESYRIVRELLEM